MANNPYRAKRPTDRGPTEEELKFFQQVTDGQIEYGDWLADPINEWAYGMVSFPVTNHTVYRYMPPPEV